MNLVLSLLTVALLGSGAVQAAARPAAEPERKSKVWAIVVGIDRCEDRLLRCGDGFSAIAAALEYPR